MKIILSESQYKKLIIDLLTKNLINEDVTSQTSSYPTDSNKIKAFQDWVDSLGIGWVLVKNTGTSNDGKFKRLNKGDGYGVMGTQTKKVWDYLSTAYNYWNQRLANPKDTTIIKKFQDSLTIGKTNLNKLLLQQRKEWENSPKYDQNPNVPKTSDISKVPGFRPEDDAKKDIAAQAEYAKARESTLEAENEREREARLRYKLWSDKMESEGLIPIAFEEITNIVKGKFDQIMEDLRQFLGGGVISVLLQTLIDMTPLGRIINTAGWAILTLYDLSKKKWVDFIFSMIGLLTAGVLGKQLFGFIGKLKGVKANSLEEGAELIAKNPEIKGIVSKSISTITNGLSTAESYVAQAVKYISEVLGVSGFDAWVKPLFENLRSFVQNLGLYFGTTTAASTI
jgi:hypothetical protein